MLQAGITKGPEKVYLVHINAAGAALIAGEPTVWAYNATNDGIAVDDLPNAIGNVVGLAKAADADAARGLTLAYGPHDAAIIVHTNSDITVGSLMSLTTGSSCIAFSISTAASGLYRNMFAAGVSHTSSSGTDTLKVAVYCL